jgi:hypothetical protein
LREPLVLDGFESFEFSQYYPTSYHVAAGQRSHFFYGFTESECRRRGTMTRFQKRRRAELEARLGRPDPKSIEKEVAALLAILVEAPGRIELHTDEHQSYPRAVRRLAHLAIAHFTISSRAARIPQNPLFAINLLDFLIRHNGANCKRETAAFSKRRASAALRLAVFLVWRNYIQPFSERRRGPTPAMRLGLIDRRLSVEDVLAVAAIESFNETILHRLAWFDELQGHAMLFGPVSQSQSDELWTVVCSELEGIAADSGYPFKLAHHSLGSQAEVHHDRQGFAIEVVNDIKSPEATTVPQGITHEVC